MKPAILLDCDTGIDDALTVLYLAALARAGDAELVAAGGAFDHPGNVTSHAEANIWHDPEAAELVFAAGWPLLLADAAAFRERLLASLT